MDASFSNSGRPIRTGHHKTKKDFRQICFQKSILHSHHTSFPILPNLLHLPTQKPMQLPCIAISRFYVLFSILCLHHLRRHANCRAISRNGFYGHGTSTKDCKFTYSNLINNPHTGAAINTFFDCDFSRNVT